MVGKTIQTIGLLAYLASNHGKWGPHLIVVPSSCIVNWECEIKRFCPGLKVLAYYGSTKTRKTLRVGWTKPNSFHVCITSYQLIVQDASVFRRKRWYYLILDEAHNIKNFKSKRWQILLNFNTQRRLLLTGTPLQNNLMELWSLMHFLMPNVFSSRSEFSYWFNNPLSNAIEGNRPVRPEIIEKLHELIRPFVLRRLKRDVAQQLPRKFEHLLFCKLSKRQSYLYEEFMSRSAVQTNISSGNYIGMMNALMQLRKICNHPDLLEPRLVVSPVIFPGVVYSSVKLIDRLFDYDPLTNLSNGMSVFWLEDVASFDRSFLENHVHTLPVGAEQNFSRNLDEFKSSLELHRRNSRNRIMNRLARYHSLPKISFDWFIMKSCLLPNAPSTRSKIWTDVNWKSLYQCSYEWVQLFTFVISRVYSQPKLVSSSASADIPARTVSGYDVVSHALNLFNQLKLQQTVFFPNKKLVQYDSGKLQELAFLLRRLKAGRHKCLIFTQMAKMLDILELFLNLNNHSYVRLDGSTSIDERQKLMDRFNSDEKLFCFILSTRSGGIGINLTGADVVIFYDTDWNPAMDAQAQDRAHRIGQTRDVHIYRLITESSIEQNILLKAQQKRQLDALVMNEGNFSENSLFSAQSLRSMFGSTNGSSNANPPPPADVCDMEAAMIAAEDEDDVRAMKTLKIENESDLSEFQEAGNVEQTSDKPKEPELEAEFILSDVSLLEKTLKPIECYSVRFVGVFDPPQLMIGNNLPFDPEMSNAAAGNEDKSENETEEATLDDLIIANAKQSKVSQYGTWYSKMRREKKLARIRRQITGEGWRRHIFENVSFWYNHDTGEVSYQTPKVITDNEEYAEALRRRFDYVPIAILLHVMSYLSNHPDRFEASLVCAKWRQAYRDDSFLLRVVPLEYLSDDKVSRSMNVYPSISEAITNATDGDTILLVPGHYQENGITFDKTIRIVSAKREEGQPVVQVNGSSVHIGESATAVYLSGIRFSGMNLHEAKSLINVTKAKLVVSSIISVGDRVRLFPLSFRTARSGTCSANLSFVLLKPSCV